MHILLSSVVPWCAQNPQPYFGTISGVSNQNAGPSVLVLPMLRRFHSVSVAVFSSLHIHTFVSFCSCCIGFYESTVAYLWEVHVLTGMCSVSVFLLVFSFIQYFSLFPLQQFYQNCQIKINTDECCQVKTSSFCLNFVQFDLI